MAVYDLEEQDQLEDLKVWWSQWGNYVTSGVLVICIAILGVQGWRFWQHSQAEKASLLYTAVSDAVRKNDLAKAADAMTQLTGKYASTGYTPRAAMLVARLKYDNGDKAGAKADLEWIIDRSSEDELKQVARYRLAEVQLDEKKYDDALRTLDAKHDEPFDGLYADLRGDILSAAGRNDEARTSYQAALAKLDAKSPYRNYVEVKLNALGGPRAAPPAGVTTPGPAAAGPAALPLGAVPAAPVAAPAPAPAPPASAAAPTPAAAPVAPAPPSSPAAPK